VYHESQTQIFIFLVLLMIAMTGLWFFMLDSYFRFLEKHNEALFIKLGSPNLRRLKLAKEMELLGHLLSSLSNLVDKRNDQTVTELLARHRKIRNFFIIYVLVFLMIFPFVFTLV